ncbi:MAG: response regulator [Pseudomonadota bacterium]
MADQTFNVFFIDDSSDEYLLSRILFRRQGVRGTLHHFTTFDAFVDYVSARPELGTVPALVAVDLNLTLMSGTECVLRLRRRRDFDNWIVGICSGSEDPADRASSYAAGADFFVPKPLDRKCLETITRICTANSRSGGRLDVIERLMAA